MSSDTRLTLTTVVVVAALSAIVGWIHFQRSLRALVPIQEVAAGVTLSAPPGYAWNSSDTLVLALKVGCPHCENEMKFYEQLSSLKRDHNVRGNLLAVFPDSEDDVSRAFAGRLVYLPKLAGVDFRRFHIAGTHPHSGERLGAC